MKMNILLIGPASADEIFSIEGFSKTLLAGLPSKGCEVRLIAPRPVFSRLPVPRAGMRKWLSYLDKFLMFPRDLRRALAWADVVHVCDQGSAIYMKHLEHVPHIVTCNDLLAIRSARGEFEGWKTGPTGRVYQRLILEGLNRAKYAACISEATRQDLIRISRMPVASASVVYDGFFHDYRPMPPEESAGILGGLGVSPEWPYLLHVGGNNPNKNRRGLLQIFQALRQEAGFEHMRLVMAGRPLTEEMRRSICAQKMASAVTELISPDDEALRALYSLAQGMIFPSLYEGFGLPIIEAQACGCPVFTSNRAPMTEVGGEAAVYFDPAQPQQAARQIIGHLDKSDWMVEAGFENIKRFDTQRMLEDYVQIYRRVYGK